MATPLLDALEMVQLTTPSSPASGRNLVYFKSDGKLYILNSSGVETQLGASAFLEINASTSGAIAAAVGDIVNTTATASVTLPASPGLGGMVLINRVNHTNTITIAANSGETINGQSSVAAATNLGTDGNYSGQILCIAASSTEWIAIGSGTDLGLGLTVGSQLNVNGPLNFNGALQAHVTVQGANYASSFNDFMIEVTATATITLNSFGGGIQVVANTGSGTATVGAGSGQTMAATARTSIPPGVTAVYCLDNSNVWETIAIYSPNSAPASGSLGSAYSTTTSMATFLSTASLAVGTWMITLDGLFELSTSAAAVDLEVQATQGTATATLTGQTATQVLLNGAQAESDVTPFSLSFIATITAAGALAFQAKTSATTGTPKILSASTVSSLAGVTGYTAVRIPA